MNNLDLIGYMLLTGISLFFTGLAFNRKRVLPMLITGVCWTVTSLIHGSLFYNSALLPVSYLYIGFALIFYTLTIIEALNYLKA